MKIRVLWLFISTTYLVHDTLCWPLMPLNSETMLKVFVYSPVEMFWAIQERSGNENVPKDN